MPPRAAEEFRRVRTEISLGLTLSQALSHMGERMQNADLNLIVTAVNIHNQVGGNLSTMLTAVTGTVRDRDRLFREARVITTQQRYTSYLLSLLPIFMAGIIIFSIGEMTAHPKYISYIGLIAPEDKKALYLGYSFLYGVLGSGIGGVLGANLYVHFVDKLNNPSMLWFIFSLIGVATIIGLLLYNKFLAPKKY